MTCRRTIIALIAWTVLAVSADERVEAPDFALPGLDGPNYRLSEYRGEVVALTFWAKWCGACADELVGLQRTGESFDDGFQALAISLDRRVDDATNLSARLDLDYPLMIDTRKTVGRLYGLDDLPATVIIDQRGLVRWRYSGRKTRGTDGYADHVRSLMDE